ncbi:MAG: hypothetical protein OIF57_04660 [Marinobacterium sp.]|nr:hypothetical protein [Marinobacterium sp.]
MDSYLFWISLILSMPMVYVSTRVLVRYLLSFLPDKVTVRHTTKAGNTYTETIYVRGGDDLTVLLDDVTARAKASREKSTQQDGAECK